MGFARFMPMPGLGVRGRWPQGIAGTARWATAMYQGRVERASSDGQVRITLDTPGIS